MTGAFDIPFGDLPSEIPVFPLKGVILLPRMQLPLNVFEPRYLAMVSAALAQDRLIGMIQPKMEGGFFRTGCAGRIVNFEETEDGRILITLKGLCRFDVAAELPQAPAGFRRVTPDWSAYRGDYAPDTATDICREAMTKRLQAYLAKIDMNCDRWDDVKTIPCEKLVSTLSMVCPFGADEKQSLLEAPDLKERARLLQAFLDNEIAACAGKGHETCH